MAASLPEFFAVENDLIGGYDVSEHNKPVSNHSFDAKERTLGTFMSKHDAQLVATSLNHYRSCSADLVDLHLIAKRLFVPVDTVNKWRYRELLPPPDYPELRNPVWNWETIEEWAKSTGRLQVHR